jgi:hypothetical protein
VAGNRLRFRGLDLGPGGRLTFQAAEARARDVRWIALDAPRGAGLARGRAQWAKDLDPGSHTLAIEGWDAAGNHVRAACSLVRKEPTTASTIGMPVRKSRFTSRGNFLEIHLRGREPEMVELRGLTPSGESTVLAPIVLRARRNRTPTVPAGTGDAGTLDVLRRGLSLSVARSGSPEPGELTWPISSLKRGQEVSAQIEGSV